MKAETKSYLVKTLVAIALMILGAWGYQLGGKTNHILGAICFVAGFIIMAVIYGEKWLYWWLR